MSATRVSDESETPPGAPPLPEQEALAKGIKYSLIGHGIALAVILIKSLVFPGSSVPYIPSLRVDIVGLPDILKKDLKNPGSQATNQEIEKALKEAEKPVQSEKLKAPEKEMAKPDEMVLHPKKAGKEKNLEKKNLSALQRLKALSKFSEEDSPSKLPKVIKGNAVSKGSSLSGDARESLMDNYYDILRDRLQENWALNPLIARQRLSAQVQVFVDNHGRLHGFRFTKLSGNSQFDDAVKKALQSSQPFPPPPSNIANSILMDGILVGFPL
ncbi:MAG: TonB C-terminal domain-containing protein [Bdellovibrionota bacterium]